MGTALQNMLLGLQPHTKAAASLMRDLGISAKDGAADSFYQLDGTLKPLPDIIGILNDKFGGLNDKQKEAALATTFTKYGLAGLNTIVTESKDKFNAFKDSLMQENAADIAKEKMNNLQGDMWRVQAAVSTLSKSFGNTLEPAMRSIAQATLSVVQWFNNLSPSTKQTIMVIGGIASAMVTVGGAILTFVSTLGFLKMGLKGLELSFTEVLSPVGLVVGAIALLGVGAYELYTHWGQVKAATQELHDKFVALKSEAVDALKKAWDDMKQAVQTVESKFTEFKQNAIDTVNNAIKGLTDTYNSHKTAINAVATVLGVIFGPALIQAGVQAGVAGAQLAGQFIVNVVKTGTEAVIAGGKMTAQFIANITQAGAEAVIAGGKMTAQFIAGIIQSGAEAVVAGGKIALNLTTAILDLGMNAAITGAKMTGQLITAVVSFALEGWKTAAAVGAQTVALVANAAAIVAQKVALAASTIATGAMTAAQWALNAALDANPIGLVILAIGALIAIGYEVYKHWDELKQKALDLWHTIENNPLLALIAGPIGALIAAGIEVYKNWDTIKEKASDLWHGIKSIFNSIRIYVTGLWAEAVEWGINLIQGFMNGVENMAQQAVSAVTNVAHSIVSAAKNVLGIHSPSVVFNEIGQNVAQGLSNGLNDGAPQVAGALNSLMAPLTQAFSGGGNISIPDVSMSPGSTPNFGASIGLSKDQIDQVKIAGNEIIDAKMKWAEASKKGDQAAMDAAHRMADDYRAKLAAMGVDTTNFAADKSIQQAIIARDQITSQAMKQLDDNYRMSTTNMMADNTNYSASTTLNTTMMGTQWTAMSTKISDTTLKMRQVLTEVFKSISDAIKASSTIMEDSMVKAFDQIASNAMRAAQQVVSAVNEMRAAMASVGIAPQGASVGPIGSGSSIMPFAGGGGGRVVNVNINSGAIQIQGGGQDAKGHAQSMMGEMMKIIRQQMKYAI